MVENNDTELSSTQKKKVSGVHVILSVSILPLMKKKEERKKKSS